MRVLWAFTCIEDKLLPWLLIDLTHSALILPYPGRNVAAELVLLVFVAILDAMRVFLGEHAQRKAIETDGTMVSERGRGRGGGERERQRRE